MRIILRFRLSIFLVLLPTVFAQAQSQFYEIIQIGNKYSQQDLSTSISNADWCGYFNSDNRFKLTFDDGSVVELLSKKELSSTEYKVDCFQNEKTEDLAIYKIHESGIIVRMVSARNTSKN